MRIYAHFRGPRRMPSRLNWSLPVAAALILLITMGGRQTLGLFVDPLDQATGFGIVSISLAIATGQLVWGLAQPVFGGLADRFGPGRVIATGGLMLAAGLALTPFVQSEWALIMTIGIISAFGAGAGSLSILIGAVSQSLPPERRSLVAGFVNAGGSLGQFVFAPLVALAIAAFGWVIAMLALAASMLATLPLALPLRRRQPAAAPARASEPDIGVWRQLAAAARDRSYWWLNLG